MYASSNRDKKPNTVKKYVFLAECMKNLVLREKTANKIEENEPAKLNKLHKTDYIEEKTNRQTNTVTTESHDSYTCQTFLKV